MTEYKCERCYKVIEGYQQYVLHYMDKHPSVASEANITGALRCDQGNLTTATKYNKGKTRISILPLKAIEFVKKVGEMGAAKYGDHNYRQGRPVSDWLDAAYRHGFDEFLGKGIDIDDESKLPHLAHAAWNFLAALEQMLDKPELDDRYKK